MILSERHKSLIERYVEEMNKPLSEIKKGSKILMLGMGEMLIPRYVLTDVHFTIVENNSEEINEYIKFISGYRLVTKDIDDNCFKKDMFDAVVLANHNLNMSSKVIFKILKAYSKNVENFDDNHYYLKNSI